MADAIVTTVTALEGHLHLNFLMKGAVQCRVRSYHWDQCSQSELPRHLALLTVVSLDLLHLRTMLTQGPNLVIHHHPSFCQSHHHIGWALCRWRNPGAAIIWPVSWSWYLKLLLKRSRTVLRSFHYHISWELLWNMAHESVLCRRSLQIPWVLLCIFTVHYSIFFTYTCYFFKLDMFFCLSMQLLSEQS